MPSQVDHKRPELRRSKSLLIQVASNTGMPAYQVGRKQRTISESSQDNALGLSTDLGELKKLSINKTNGSKISKNNTDDNGSGNQKAVGVTTPFHRRHTSKEITMAAHASSGDPVKGMKRRLRKDEQSAGAGDKGDKKTSGDPPAAQPVKNSFQAVTQRVSRLLKVRRAIMPRAGLAADNIKEEEVLSPEEVIQALPVTPRFSSYMSPEAQFALMKGYEDLLHDQLERQHPNCGQALKRTKTPHQGVAISEQASPVDVALRNARKLQQLGKKDGKRKSPVTPRNGTKGESIGPESVATKEGATLDAQNSAKGGDIDKKEMAFEDKKLPENCEVYSPETRSGSQSTKSSDTPTQNGTVSREESISPLQNLRRLSLSFPGNVTSSLNSDVKLGVSHRKSDSSVTSLPFEARPKLSPRRSMTNVTSEDVQPTTLPHSRRLVMSYRLESAMDLLDTIKPSTEHALSPRVKVHKSRVRPLADFNHWAEQWATEFKTDKVKNGSKPNI